MNAEDIIAKAIGTIIAALLIHVGSALAQSTNKPVATLSPKRIQNRLRRRLWFSGLLALTLFAVAGWGATLALSGRVVLLIALSIGGGFWCMSEFMRDWKSRDVDLVSVLKKTGQL